MGSDFTAVLVGVNRFIISIHAPRVGSDKRLIIIIIGSRISIHAPRVGSDVVSPIRYPPQKNFNPRSPRGERLNDFFGYAHSAVFQSTLPAWGATLIPPLFDALLAFQSTLPAWGATTRVCNVFHALAISIHAPRVGSDFAFSVINCAPFNFNPRSPRGERQAYA